MLPKDGNFHEQRCYLKFFSPKKYQFGRNSHYSDHRNQGFAKFAELIHAVEPGG
jgi:hypothetical protein